jgi:UDP-N-acetylmuramoyl-L-alanyl-D-glutamate--2,6-diaminopimelate ligase
VIATSDNPRTEDPASILSEIETGLSKGPAHYRMILDRRAAIKTAVALAEKDDAVIIAGKGHESYQIIGKEVLPFDDREVARQEIAASWGRGKARA